MASDRTSRDLILAQTEYAFALDGSKGHINVYAGPYKTPMSENDIPVIWNKSTKRFERLDNLDKAIQQNISAEEGEYIILDNPAKSGISRPPEATITQMEKLDWGRKIIIPGPTSFPLWPGQSAEVIGGHQLKYNQYVLVRTYNEVEAQKNWKTAILVKPVSNQDSDGDISETSGSQKEVLPAFTMGQLMIVKGTDVSFFIPPTGVEVVRDSSGKYVRDAVTLESLEYCILLDENGNKRYEKGPAVVFPKPTEVFLEEKNSKKFKAYELTEISGIYVKVIAAYSDGDSAYKAGEELFVTGKDQAIYIPRAEHAIVKYGDSEIIYAVAVPRGEARYVLNRLSGNIDLVKGPKMLLPDPRKEVIVRRVLTPQLVKLWFPGNDIALSVNEELMEQAKLEKTGAYVESESLNNEQTMRSMSSARFKTSFIPDEIKRSDTFKAPRTIVLHTKYDGAVTLDIWDGYAVLVMSKTGERRVEVGPTTIQLAYDEILQMLELSTGTPKNDSKTIKTTFLQVTSNKVSDQVAVETSDFCKVTLTLSYRVNFEGEDRQKWFSVDNYVKFLTEHLRSRIRNAVKGFGIEEFYRNAINVVRDNVLGKQMEGKARVGLVFPENGMRVYDVEVLDVQINDAAISQLLVKAQHDSVNRALKISSEEQEFDYIKRSEDLKRQTIEVKQKTKDAESDAMVDDVRVSLELSLAKMKSSSDQTAARQKAEIEAEMVNLEGEKSKQGILDEIQQSELTRAQEAHEQDLLLKKRTEEQKMFFAKEAIEQELTRLAKETEEYVKRMSSVDDKLIAAMQAFGDKALMQKMAETMAPLAILGGDSVVDVVTKLFNGTPLSGLIAMLSSGKTSDGD